MLSQVQHVDTVLILEDVVISSERLKRFSTGFKMQTFDTAAMRPFCFGPLASLLQFSSQVNVKSYGSNGLASPAMRGGSASQTAIIWNGFNLNNAMNAQVDLNLIPVHLNQKVSVLYGGSSALWGSGAIGGAIHLENQSVFDRGHELTIFSSVGSFGMWQQNVVTSYSNQKWYFSSLLFTGRANNDFKYQNTSIFGRPEVRQNHAATVVSGTQTSATYKINTQQQINFHLWYQQNDRQIPPTMLEVLSTATQKDNQLRLASEWRHQGRRFLSQVRAAYFNERLTFQDSLRSINSRNHVKTLIVEAETKWTIFNDWLLNIGFNHTYNQAKADAYITTNHQHRSAFFASMSGDFWNEKLSTNVSIRQEFISGAKAPFTYTLGLQYRLSPSIFIKGHIAQTYRLPGLNDLYWNPGGNDQLRPENGFGQELGIGFRPKMNASFGFKWEANFFNRHTNDWIIWLPGQSFWSPKNVASVWSRGLETNTELKYQYKKLLLTIHIGTNYVLSTHQKATSSNDLSVNKQLIYIPMYSGNGQISLTYQKVSIRFLQNYIGYVYTAADHSAYLRPYFISQCFLQYETKFGKNQLNIFTQIHNLANTNYQTILHRPMPLIHFQIGGSLQFSFNKKNILP